MTPADPRIGADSRLTPSQIEEYEACGLWQRRSLRTLLADSAVRHPHRLAAVGCASGTEDALLTYAELDELAGRLAGGLQRLGTKQQDVVAVMLSNRVEFGALIFAINHAGAIYTGIPVTYGRREIEQIVGQSGAKVFIVESGEPLQRARELSESLPSLEHLVVLPGAADPSPRLLDGELLYETLLGHGPGERRDDHRAICHIGFTSGTTATPKGVMNSAQTLESILRNWVEHVGGPGDLGEPLVNLVASTIGHHTGFCWGVLLSAYLGATAVYLDRWEPARAWEVIAKQKVTAMFGAPTFVQDLMVVANTRLVRETPLRMITLAGAPVPRSLPSVAGQTLDCLICPAWGMTEYAIAISWAPRLGQAAQRTDGVPVPGAEIRVMTSTGAPAARGEPGELELRGSGLFIGYHGRPEENAASFDGEWFKTGDTAVVEDGGFVSLVGRIKDIVIRGGENIPVVEVESLLFDHPKVSDLAIIGVPDGRLGQRSCAVVVPEGGTAPTLGELCEYLLGKGLSKRFLPERLEIVGQLPRTASGKIRKAELREQFR